RINQGNHNLAIASFGPIFDQSDVTVADVLIDHRIALYPQGVNTLRSYPAEQKTRHADHLDVFNRINRSAGCNTTEQRYLTNRIGRSLFNFHRQSETPRLMFAFDQAALFQS